MTNREKTSALSTRIGGFLGIAAFVLYALKPAFVYGGFIGVMTASAMLGHAVSGELLTRVLMAGGMLLGVLSIGFIMTVLGAIVGTAFDAIVLAPIAKRAESTRAAEPHAAE